MLLSWRQVQNTHWECICWESPTEGFGLRVKVIWATGLTLGRVSAFLDEVCLAACSGGTQEEAATGLCPANTGDEVSWAAVVSQALPLVPGLHTQSWGRRHIPPFWHGGTQLAAERNRRHTLKKSIVDLTNSSKGLPEASGYPSIKQNDDDVDDDDDNR